VSDTRTVQASAGTGLGSAVEDERHLWTVLRYVERNPVSAGLVHRAEEWPWSSLTRSKHFELTGFPGPEDWLDLLAANDFEAT
jgi:hypothetical protein